MGHGRLVWQPEFERQEKIELSAAIGWDARRTCDRCGVRNHGVWSMNPGSDLRILSIFQPDGQRYWYRLLCPQCATLTMAHLQKMEIDFKED